MDETHPPSGHDVATVLQILGWVAILGGAVGGIWWYATFGQMDQPTMYLGQIVSTTQVANPVGIAVAVGVLFQGLVTGSLCLGVARVILNQIARRG